MGQAKVVQTLFVTLRRSLIGKPHFHLKVLTSLGLNKRLLCVEKPNNAAIRGMLRKVCQLTSSEMVEAITAFYAALSDNIVHQQ